MAATHAPRRRALDPAFALARRQVEAGTVPFVILGVADAAGTIRLEAVTRDAGPQVGPDAICLLASITKPIVATGVMQQVEAGTLTLATPLADLSPDAVNPSWAPVTAWHVLSHTSGIDDVDLEDLIVNGLGRGELLRRATQAAQMTPPGTRYHYASVPFDLLGEAVGAAAGEPFEALLKRTLLDPLGMTATSFDPRTDPAFARRMAPVTVGGLEGHGLAAGVQSAALVDGYTGLHLLGGGLWSSAADLLRLGRAMLRGGELDGVRILSRPLVELMTREVTAPRSVTWGGLGAAPDPLASDHYALGWGTPRADTIGSDRAFGHGGASGTRLWIDPAYDLVYVYLTGSWGLPVAPIDAVAAAVYAAVGG